VLLIGDKMFDGDFIYFQCYPMLIHIKYAIIFSRSLEFCSCKMSPTPDIAGIYLLHPL